MKLLCIGTALCALLAGAPAAQALDRQAFYLGINSGHVWFKEFDDDTAAYLVRAGYQPSRYYAVEISRMVFYDMRNRYDDFSGNTTTIEIKDGSALNFSVVGIYPFGNKLSLQGRFGLSLWNVYYETESSAFPGEIINRKDDDAALSLGLGLSYKLNDIIDIHGAVDYFSYQPSIPPLDDSTETVPMISLGIVIRPL